MINIIKIIFSIIIGTVQFTALMLLKWGFIGIVSITLNMYLNIAIVLTSIVVGIEFYLLTPD